VVVGIGANLGTSGSNSNNCFSFGVTIEMKRIILWLFVFGLSVFSIATGDLRALAFALGLSFIGVLWDWIKQRRNR